MLEETHTVSRCTRSCVCVCVWQPPFPCVFVWPVLQCCCPWCWIEAWHGHCPTAPSRRPWPAEKHSFILSASPPSSQKSLSVVTTKLGLNWYTAGWPRVLLVDDESLFQAWLLVQNLTTAVQKAFFLLQDVQGDRQRQRMIFCCQIIQRFSPTSSVASDQKIFLQYHYSEGL